MPRDSRLAIAGRRLRPLLVPTLVVVLVGLVPVTTCVVRLATGQPCPACGLTRGGLRLLVGDVAGAWHVHPLALPLTLLAAVVPLAAILASDAAWRRFGQLAMTFAGVALVVVWAARFAGAFGGACPP